MAAVQRHCLRSNSSSSSRHRGSGCKPISILSCRGPQIEIYGGRNAGASGQHYLMERPLESKIAIITGASHGLGFQIARKYLEAGASITICARNDASLEQARQTLLPALRPDQRILA